MNKRGCSVIIFKYVLLLSFFLDSKFKYILLAFEQEIINPEQIKIPILNKIKAKVTIDYLFCGKRFKLRKRKTNMNIAAAANNKLMIYSFPFENAT